MIWEGEGGKAEGGKEMYFGEMGGFFMGIGIWVVGVRVSPGLGMRGGCRFLRYPWEGKGGRDVMCDEPMGLVPFSSVGVCVNRLV